MQYCSLSTFHVSFKLQWKEWANRENKNLALSHTCGPDRGHLHTEKVGQMTLGKKRARVQQRGRTVSRSEQSKRTK